MPVAFPLALNGKVAHSDVEALEPAPAPGSGRSLPTAGRQYVAAGQRHEVDLLRLRAPRRLVAAAADRLMASAERAASARR